MLYVAASAYLCAMPFTWFRVFFGLRGARSLPARWVLASALALIWPLFVLHFVVWKRRQLRGVVGAEPETWVDEVERELHSLDH
jgi:hypothetical protein